MKIFISIQPIAIPPKKTDKERGEQLKLSAYEITLIAGGFTIIGALVGSFIGYRNALNIYKLSELNKAVAQFRSAFYPEILFLKNRIGSPETSSTDTSVHLFLNTGFVNRHAKAFLVYTSALPRRKINSAQAAWDEYQENTKQFTSNPMKQEEIDKAIVLLERFLDQHAPIS